MSDSFVTSILYYPKILNEIVKLFHLVCFLNFLFSEIIFLYIDNNII